MATNGVAVQYKYKGSLLGFAVTTANGTMVQWYNGTMVQWYNGTIVQSYYLVLVIFLDIILFLSGLKHVPSSL